MYRRHDIDKYIPHAYIGIYLPEHIIGRIEYLKRFQNCLNVIEATFILYLLYGLCQNIQCSRKFQKFRCTTNQNSKFKKKSEIKIRIKNLKSDVRPTKNCLCFPSSGSPAEGPQETLPTAGQ